MITIISISYWNPKKPLARERVRHILSHMTHCTGHTDMAISRWQCVWGWSKGASKRDTKRDRGGNREKKGSREGKKKKNGLCSESVTCIHLTFAYGTNVADVCSKSKPKLMHLELHPIQCEQSCVIFAFNSAERKKKKEKKNQAATHRKLNPTEKYYPEMWMSCWEGLGGGRWWWWWLKGFVSHIFDHIFQFESSQCQALSLNF